MDLGTHRVIRARWELHVLLGRSVTMLLATLLPGTLCAADEKNLRPDEVVGFYARSESVSEIELAYRVAKRKELLISEGMTAKRRCLVLAAVETEITSLMPMLNVRVELREDGICEYSEGYALFTRSSGKWSLARKVVTLDLGARTVLAEADGKALILGPGQNPVWKTVLRRAKAQEVDARALVGVWETILAGPTGLGTCLVFGAEGKVDQHPMALINGVYVRDGDKIWLASADLQLRGVEPVLMTLHVASEDLWTGTDSHGESVVRRRAGTSVGEQKGSGIGGVWVHQHDGGLTAWEYLGEDERYQFRLPMARVASGTYTLARDGSATLHGLGRPAVGRVLGDYLEFESEGGDPMVYRRAGQIWQYKMPAK